MHDLSNVPTVNRVFFIAKPKIKFILFLLDKEVFSIRCLVNKTKPYPVLNGVPHDNSLVPHLCSAISNGLDRSGMMWLASYPVVSSHVTVTYGKMPSPKIWPHPFQTFPMPAYTPSGLLQVSPAK